MKPTISVVTVTFNAATDLPRLFASLRGQTDRDFEFIVIDGDSKDDTKNIIASAHDIVTFTVSEADDGFFDALNKAVARVKTDYYVVIGADDEFFPDAIENFRECAARTNADMVVAGVRMGEKVVKRYRPKMRWRSPGAMFTSHSVGTLFKAHLHREFGKYTLRYPIFGDSLFMKQIAISRKTKVVLGDFVAGTFCIEGGFSNADFARSVCELWLMQRQTGENKILQFILFQLRILTHIRRVCR